MTASFETDSSNELYSLLSKYVLQSQEETERALTSDSGSKLVDICRYIVNAGGKRLRPLLTLLACEAVKGNYEKALPVSVATELAHTLGIIQDDIFDQASLRRGVKPVHIEYGIPAAILASDYLFLKMMKSILRTAELDEDLQEPTLRILNVVVKAGLEAVEGEYLDLELTEKKDASIDECLMVAQKKTGALIKAALEAGALIGGGKEEEIIALRSYGENLGLAYQIIDDLLGLTGSQSVIGKDIGADITNKRMTLVMVHALQNSSEQAKPKIMEKFRDQSLEENGHSRNSQELFKESSSITFAQKTANEYAEKAVSQLQQLQPTSARSILELIPAIIVSRKW